MPAHLSESAGLSEYDCARIAMQAHKGQRDRDGSLHIDHVQRVVMGVPDDALRVAWLHDVLEDSDYSPDALVRGLPADEWRALQLLTRHPGVQYSDYVESIACAEGHVGYLARAVKEADAMDNLRRCVQGKDKAVVRYAKALATLWDR